MILLNPNVLMSHFFSLLKILLSLALESLDSFCSDDLHISERMLLQK